MANHVIKYNHLTCRQVTVKVQWICKNHNTLHNNNSINNDMYSSHNTRNHLQQHRSIKRLLCRVGPLLSKKKLNMMVVALAYLELPLLALSWQIVATSWKAVLYVWYAVLTDDSCCYKESNICIIIFLYNNTENWCLND